LEKKIMKITLKKSDYFTPAFSTKDGASLQLKRGVRIDGDAHEIQLPKKLVPGTDYEIRYGRVTLRASVLNGIPNANAVGGFHVGLDGKIAVHSLWDILFRPNCMDPRGMVFVPSVGWVDIYLLNTNPAENGTSRAGKQIADGKSPIDGRPLNWWTAVHAFAQAGKTLLSKSEFAIAMEGSEEGKTCGSDPIQTGHAPGLKSIYGIEQATGCMWTWSREIEGLNGPWMYILGGGWDSAAPGPRRFNYGVPGGGWLGIGARGRCDHLIPGSEAKA
jgi:hypothetical protein